MNYKKTRISLNTLNDLLTQIEGKEKERENAVEYNKTNSIKELEINVQDIINERVVLQYEFRDLTLTLRT